MLCNNCNKEVDSPYCPSCGQATSLKRIDGHYILHEIEHVLHLDRGILYTIRELLIHPGQTVKKFLTESRSRIVKPVIFIILTSLIYTLITHFFHLEFEFVHFQGLENSYVAKILNWVKGHYGYSNMLTSGFIALWLKLFFKKYDYNFFELLILLCYVIGMQMLIFGLLAILQGITGFKFEGIAGILGFAYLVWAVGNFFGSKKIINYVKAMASYILGIAMFYGLIILVGRMLDGMIK